MSAKTYWLDLFSAKTWREFNDAGGDVSGFRESRWKTLQSMKPGDVLICYMTGISRLIGLLEVTSEPFKDTTVIWIDNEFPARVRVKVIAGLTPETGVPIQDLRDELSFFQNLKSPFQWTGHFRGSPTRWSQADGEAAARAILEANENPVVRPVDPGKLQRKPPILSARIGPVTVPEETTADEENLPARLEPRLHTEIQYLLLKLGGDMGMDVWAARNDRGREFRGHKFDGIRRLKKELPLQFDEATTRTIELIDVLWLRGNAISAAFEIECTTSVYSGLLRMADLIAMQPNINIPLYLVAPDERRNKVISEVNRPTFKRLDPPLNEVCRFIPIAPIRNWIAQIAPLIDLRHVKPEFLEDYSESCDVSDV